MPSSCRHACLFTHCSLSGRLNVHWQAATGSGKLIMMIPSHWASLTIRCTVVAALLTMSLLSGWAFAASASE